MKGLEVLQEKLEKHKECLKDVDVLIKRMNGRELIVEDRNESLQNRALNSSKENNENNSSMKQDLSSSNRDTSKRRDAFGDTNRNRTLKRRYNDDSRYRTNHARSSDNESDTEEPLPKHTLQSSVISKQVVIKSKDDLIKLQNKDTGSEQRNKRIFGMILGTLQKFKTEDKARSESAQAKQRKEIEKKIETKEQQEKNKIKEERSELYKEKRRQQTKIRIIEQKLQMVQELEIWCKQQMNYKNFIKTQTKPHIFYKPKIMETKTEKLLSDCANAIENEISKRKADTEKEIEILANEEENLSSKDANNVSNSNENSRFKKDISDTDTDMDDDNEDVKIGDAYDDEDINVTQSNIQIEEQNSKKIENNSDNDEKIE